MSQDSERPESPAQGEPQSAPEAGSSVDASAGTASAAPEPAASGPSPWRRRGWAAFAAVAGIAVCVILMCSERALPGSLPVGFLACVVSVLGWLVLATPASSEPDAPARPGRPVLRASALLGVALVAHLAAVVLAVAGVLPFPRASASLLVTASYLGLLVAGFRWWQRLGWFDSVPGAEVRPLLHRHGFWLLAGVGLVYLPMLGNFALLDPWETHYGEVSREMLARRDWISLWWAQDGWFFTKPILNFWIQGLSFDLFGVGIQPDHMLAGALEGYVPGPEWACRLPGFWMTVAAVYALYKASSKLVGRRAALLGGVILSSCPYWLILARQTMADMPYVAPLSVAAALLLLAFHTDPEVRVREYRIAFGSRTLRFDAYHVLFGVILLCVVPQVAYLLSRNVTLHLGNPFGFRPHLDEFAQGSGGGNCGLPGNKRCHAAVPAHPWGEPGLFALYWLGLAIGLLFWNRRERRAQRLLFLGAWFATALSAMAKGAPGLVLPLVTGVGYALVTARFRDLLRMKLPSLLVLMGCVALPWYVQMYMRHGWPFLDRLIMHDMVNRAFSHVHDTNKGEDVTFRYYIWQLGYGLFPWTGLVAGGLVWWARTVRDADSRRQQFATFMLFWFLAGFGMFSLTLTKFHHYVLPLVPPAAMLTGVLASAYIPKRPFQRPRRALLYGVLMLVCVELFAFGVACFLPGWKEWFLRENAHNPASPWLGAALCLAGLGLFAGLVRAAGGLGPRSSTSARDWALSVVGLSAAVATLLAGRDMVATDSGVRGELRLLHLVTYNYDRPWPENLDLRGPIAGFVAVAVLGSLLLSVPRLRRHAMALLTAAAVLWSMWCCDDYLVRIAPHWSQRDDILAYYRARKDPSHPLVAYQMNWKGENFYTGNRMATFVASGAKFKRWVKKKRRQGVNVMYFTTEHTRIKTLKKELGSVQSFELLTTEAQNNKFFMAKVVFPPYKAPAKEEPDEDDEEDDEE
jgi:4-amino-4-deoxy-L-arabinose transferase-like glycosyltransferase